MWVVGATIHFQLSKNLASEPGLRQHASDSMFDHTLGVLLQNHLELFVDCPPRETRVMEVLLQFQSLTRDLHAGSVDDNNKVTDVGVWSEPGVVLSPEEACNFGRNAPKSLSASIDQMPLLFNVRGCKVLSFIVQKTPD